MEKAIELAIVDLTSSERLQLACGSTPFGGKKYTPEQLVTILRGSVDELKDAIIAYMEEEDIADVPGTGAFVCRLFSGVCVSNEFYLTVMSLFKGTGSMLELVIKLDKEEQTANAADYAVTKEAGDAGDIYSVLFEVVSL